MNPSQFIPLALLNRRLAVMFPLGFLSGLPLALTAGTLQAWLTVEGVDLKTIGIFTLVGLPYTIKFLWAPVIDRLVPPWLGRRRGWMVLTQQQTIQKYLFIMENTYILKLVRPFSGNIRSELFKLPKIFFYDTGIMQMLWLKGLQKELIGSVFETGIFAELVKIHG